MSKVITVRPDNLDSDMRSCYNNWTAYLSSMVHSVKIVGLNYSGDDLNLAAHNSTEEYAKWFGQPPSNVPYRDSNFYTRDLTMLSMWALPTKVVEVGTARGMGTLFLSRVNPYAEIVTIDVNEHAMFDGEMYEVGYIARHNNCNARFLRMKSWDYVVDQDVGMYFIDGDHSRDAVLMDSDRAWANRNKSGRWVIAWHDYTVGDNSMVGNISAVNDFVAKVQRPAFRFEDSSTVWMYGGSL
jgi:hypothetical protein